MTTPARLLAAPEAAALIYSALERGDTSAADRYITEAASRLLTFASSVPIPPSVIAEPAGTGSEQYDTLLATTFLYALTKLGAEAPEWAARPAPLEHEWLWDGDASASDEFRSFIRKNTPPLFLSKNILLRERDLIAL